MDFLWHRVTEKEKDEIKKEAKAIMDRFSKKLSKIDKPMKDPLIERPECERPESKGECNELDRDLFMENAPDKNKDFIIGERKRW